MTTELLVPTTPLQGGDAALVNRGGRPAMVDLGEEIITKVSQVTSGFNVRAFGARGDGITDDTAAILSASTACGAGALVFPPGTYLFYSGITQPTGQHWVGTGGQRATNLKKMFNGDLLTMGSLASISDINIIGNGAACSGRGIYVASGFSQKISRVRVDMTEGPCLEFADGAGGGTKLTGFEGGTASPDTVGAIKLGSDLTPRPKFMDGIWLSGGYIDMTAQQAGNGSSLTNFYIKGFLTAGTITTGPSLFHVSNGRCATAGAPLTFSGSDWTISNVAFAGPVNLVSAQGFNFTGCTLPTGVTEDDSSKLNSWNTSGDNAYDMVWSQSSGTQPDIGNGTIAAKYVRTGRTCIVSFRITIGSTTTLGNNSTSYRFSLPFRAIPTMTQRGIPIRLFDLSASTDFLGWLDIGANETTFSIGRNGAGFRSGFPFTLAEGDVVDGQFTYLAK